MNVAASTRNNYDRVTYRFTVYLGGKFVSCLHIRGCYHLYFLSHFNNLFQTLKNSQFLANCKPNNSYSEAGVGNGKFIFDRVEGEKTNECLTSPTIARAPYHCILGNFRYLAKKAPGGRLCDFFHHNSRSLKTDTSSFKETLHFKSYL